MAFYDIDLEKKIESNHELRKINEGMEKLRNMRIF